MTSNLPSNYHGRLRIISYFVHSDTEQEVLIVITNGKKNFETSAKHRVAEAEGERLNGAEIRTAILRPK